MKSKLRLVKCLLIIHIDKFDILHLTCPFLTLLSKPQQVLGVCTAWC